MMLTAATLGGWSGRSSALRSLQVRLQRNLWQVRRAVPSESDPALRSLTRLPHAAGSAVARRIPRGSKWALEAAPRSRRPSARDQAQLHHGRPCDLRRSLDVDLAVVRDREHFAWHPVTAAQA